jgi:hypothetical protein
VEIKKGEFYDGLKYKYISTEELIERTDMYRCLLAYKNKKPSLARRLSKTDLYNPEFFLKEFEDPLNADFEEACAEIYTSYKIRTLLFNFEKKKDNFGNALQYGKYGVLCAASYLSLSKSLGNLKWKTKEQLDNQSETIANEILMNWIAFESDIIKYKHNNIYVDHNNKSFNFDNYYKGKTLDVDLKKYFFPMQLLND